MANRYHIGAPRPANPPFTDREWNLLVEYCKRACISKARYIRGATLVRLEKDLEEMAKAEAAWEEKNAKFR